MPDESSHLASSLNTTTLKGTIPLTSDGKRTLACTELEANRLTDYWIGSEHLVLGILREGSTKAANKLRGVGLDLDSCRCSIVAHASSMHPDAIRFCYGFTVALLASGL